MKTILTLLIVLVFTMPLLAQDEPDTCTIGVDEGCMMICTRDIPPKCVCASPNGEICVYPTPPEDIPPDVIIEPQDNAPQMPRIRMPAFNGLRDLIRR